MNTAMNRKGVRTSGEASKTIAWSLLSHSLFGQLILFCRLIFENREKGFPPTVRRRAHFRTCGS